VETRIDFRFLKPGPAGPTDNSGLRLRMEGRPRPQAAPVEAELRRIARERLARGRRR